ncbi:MAG: hypothetical protein F6K37_22795 [Moorea sp. SIO4E2]|uniref:hypothetical protein n=1 Tax=Moorena sp. SIO4E2 TaxID=2607826 RepID=UPI0013B9C110|nr:hypothetical protein [Moorena sp. SIO4E2]NEQ08672.1 hypothetical protein [Moorena sp. SIO4E2]
MGRCVELCSQQQFATKRLLACRTLNRIIAEARQQQAALEALRKQLAVLPSIGS